MQADRKKLKTGQSSQAYRRAGSTNRWRNCERVALDLSTHRNSFHFSPVFPQFPRQRKIAHHNDTIKSNYVGYSREMCVTSGCFQQKSIQLWLHTLSQLSQGLQPASPSAILSTSCLDNDNTLDQFHTSDSEELPVISTRQSSTFTYTYTYNTYINI